MSRSERDGLLVWITVFMLALVAVLAVGLAASLSGQLDRRGGAVDEWARSLLPLAVAILIAGLAL
ncbi:MAG: hypothetical protein GX961_01170, partial [Firmicutes bacterium]|nr:hypothetical protein [Bacillota bacterium]